MEAPEYLDLDEIDFSDDSYSVTSLKSIPELSRRSDGPAEERPERPSGVCAVDGERNRSHSRAELHQRASQPDPLRCPLRTGNTPTPGQHLHGHTLSAPHEETYREGLQSWLDQKNVRFCPR
uniref:Uncharacterized protein n=1 Tax=Stegastes partitus TaxID=144197 RepID=A0A3B5B512_9TELE